MPWDAIIEEITGSLCGLPPGTLTAAKAMGALAAAAPSDSAEATTEEKTSEMSREEKRVVATAVHNLALTAKRDNPRWSSKKCQFFGMKVLVAASQIYSEQAFKKAMLDALSRNPRKNRRLIRRVLRTTR